MVSGATALALAFVASASAWAADAETISTDVEAWYVVRPTCPAVTCPPPPATAASPHPPGTLHVGVSGGSETSRTYITLDLAALRSAGAPTGGTLRLPIAGAEAGTVAPETATLQVCLGTEPFEEVEGSTATPPSFSCGVSSDAMFTPGEGERADAFTVDLARFASRLRDAGTSLVILPTVDSLEAPTTWHVAFSRRSRQGTDVEPITAQLAFDGSPGPSIAPSAPVPPTSGGAPTATPALTVERPTLSALPLPDVVPPAAISSGEVVAQQAVLPARSVPTAPGRGFEQPAIFAVPLVLLVVGGYLAWALTRPVRLEAA
jgi:hypothetical protein